jgi:hypothetical protein
MMLEEAGFVDVRIGEAVDTFGGAIGEENARAYEVYGYAFVARKPTNPEGEPMSTVAETTPG